MNICLVSQEYPPETPWGGIGTQTRNKAHGLAALGHTVHVLTRARHEGADDRVETADGVVVHRTCPPGYDFPIYGRAAYMFGYSWHVLRHLNRLMAEKPFDIVDVPEFGGEGFAYQLDRTCWNWAPVVVHLHGSLAMFADHTGWPEKGCRFHEYGTFTESFSVRRADGLLASAGSHADLISRHYGVSRESIAVVHCGVDADLFSPDPAVAPPERPTVLFVGNIIENKGVHIVVEAVIRLRAKYPTIHLQIIGEVTEGTDLMDQIRARLAAERAEGYVEFVGFVPAAKLPDYYRRAHVFCSPAEFEGGTANVYLEALGCGCPVIASTAGGGAETVEDGRTGFLVPPNDVTATAAALDRILADPAAGRAMGRAGRARIEEYFAMDRFARRVEAAYERTIARAKDHPEHTTDLRE